MFRVRARACDQGLCLCWGSVEVRVKVVGSGSGSDCGDVVQSRNARCTGRKTSLTFPHSTLN